jgi:acyl-CoA thioester hydrolase
MARARRLVTYRHTIRVRYGECDMQRVVFNAHYFAYCDDAVDTWFRTVLAPGGGKFEEIGFDFMLKKAELVWHAPLTFGETADLDCSVVRWGSTSFDVRVEGTADGKQRFDATITYVSTVPHENRPQPVPSAVRDLLGGSSAT